mgnify:CR=1 FL=1
MAKSKKVPEVIEHFVYLLLDSESGMSIAYSSPDGAAEDLDFFQSHLNRSMAVLKIRYAYDRLPLPIKMKILDELKPL